MAALADRLGSGRDWLAQVARETWADACWLARYARDRVRALVRWLVRCRAALLAALALLGGWALLTWGVASLLAWQVWPISAGILLLSLFGWKLLFVVGREGLYALTRDRG